MYLVRHWRVIPRPRLLAVVLVYVAVAAVATVLAMHPPLSLYGAPRRLLGLTSILDGAALSAAAALFVRAPRDLYWIAVAAFGAAGVVLAYGLVQLAKLDPLTWVDPLTTSTIGNSGAFAGYASVAAAATGTVLLLRWERLGLMRLPLIALALTGVFEVLAVGARSPSLALPVAAVASLMFGWRSRAEVLRALPVRSVLAVCMLALLGLALTVPFTNAGVQLMRLLQGGDLSTAERAVIYRASLEVIGNRPLFGVGPDGFVAVFLTLRSADSIRLAGLAETQSSTHSWFLHQAVGTGIFGLFAILGLVGFALLETWRRAGRTEGVAPAVAAITLVVYLAQGAFNIPHVATDWIFWLSIGLIATPPLVALPDSRVRIRQRGPVDFVPLLTALAVGALLAYTVTGGVLASHAARSSVAARAAGNFPIAEAFARQAVGYDPGRADYWNLIGLALEKQSAERALTAFARAAELAPYEPVYLLNAARQEALLASRAPRYRDMALSRAGRATQIDPHGPATLRRAAEILLALGEPQEALHVSAHLLELVPDVPRHYELASLAHEALGDYRPAVELLRQMISLTNPQGDAAPEIRVRLARLYESMGESEQARSVYAPPRVVGIERCPGDPTRPTRCMELRYTSEVALIGDPGMTTSVMRLANFVLDGQPLPAGTRITYNERTIRIALPDGIIARSGTTLVMRDFADSLGTILFPNPTIVTVP